MDRNLPLGGGDSEDLPRTLRREKEAREREAREREMRAQSSFGPPEPVAYPPAATSTVLSDDAHPAVVRRFDVPFGHLVVFFLKAAVAAIPALLLLTVVAIAIGMALKQVPGMPVFKLELKYGWPSSEVITPVAPRQPGAAAVRSKG